MSRESIKDIGQKVLRSESLISPFNEAEWWCWWWLELNEKSLEASGPAQITSPYRSNSSTSFRVLFSIYLYPSCPLSISNDSPIPFYSTVLTGTHKITNTDKSDFPLYHHLDQNRPYSLPSSIQCLEWVEARDGPIVKHCCIKSRPNLSSSNSFFHSLFPLHSSFSLPLLLTLTFSISESATDEKRSQNLCSSSSVQPIEIESLEVDSNNWSLNVVNEQDGVRSHLCEI